MDHVQKWRTADGRHVAINEMDLGHLVNVINWILDNRKSYPERILKAMIKEAEARQLVLFARGEPYPQKFHNGWKVVDPKTGRGDIIPPPADYIEAVKDNDIYQSMFKRTQAKRKNRSQ